MNKPQLIVLIFALIAAESSVNAKSAWPRGNRPLDLNFLYHACKESREMKTDYSRGYCDGAIQAALTEIDNHCVPGGTTKGKMYNHLIDTIVDLELPPGIFSINIPDFLEGSLSIKWPCRKN